MAHATHFLSRLERVSAPHVELALSLYRDTAMLRDVLARAGFPGSTERVAIELDSTQQAPALIVTGEGRFVTCLGPGMKRELPVITRASLDRISERVTLLRTRLRQAKELTGSEAPSRKLLARIFEAGPLLAREEMAALCAWRDTLGPQYLTCFADISLATMDRVDTLLSRDKVRPKDEGLLRAIWDGHWAIGHLALLAAETVRDLISRHGQNPELARTLIGFSGRTGLGATLVRTAWATAVVGKDALPPLKQQWCKAGFSGEFVAAGLPMVALASRHRKLMAEVTKAFGRQLDGKFGSIANRQTQAKFVGEAMLMGLDAVPEEMSHAKLAAAMETIRAALPGRRSVLGAAMSPAVGLAILEALVDEPYKALVGDAPFDVMVAASTLLLDVYAYEPGALVSLLPCITAYTANLSPEGFYLPSEWIDRVSWQWTPDVSIGLIESLRGKVRPRLTTVVAGEKVGRNEPCKCGSGRKYKKCCAA